MPWIRWDCSYSGNPKTKRLSWEAAWCFNRVALWAKELNDGGCVPASDLEPDNLAALLSTKTSPPAHVCERMVKEWLAVGYLEQDGTSYVLPAFRKLQGDPGAAERMKRYRNERNARNVTDVTTTDTRQLRDETRQDKEEEGTSVPLSTSGPKVDDVRHIFDHWCSAMGKRKSAKMTSDRRTKIQARLRDGYSVADLEQAITNAAADSWTMGDNDRHKAFNDITTLFKGGASVDRYLDMTPAGPTVEEDEDPGEVRLAYFRRMMEREGIEYVAGFMDTSDPMDAWVMAQLERER